MPLRRSLRPCNMDIPREEAKNRAFLSHLSLLDSDRRARASGGDLQGMLWAAVGEACLQGMAEPTFRRAV